MVLSSVPALTRVSGGERRRRAARQSGDGVRRRDRWRRRGEAGGTADAAPHVAAAARGADDAAGLTDKGARVLALAGGWGRVWGEVGSERGASVIGSSVAIVVGGLRWRTSPTRSSVFVGI